MATLKSTIELYDNFSAPMMNIISTANAGAAAVENVEAAMSQSINGNGFAAVEQGASRAEAAVNSLSEAVAAMSAPSFTVNADGQLSFDIPEQMTIDIDASVNSQKIVELQERLQGVNRMQTAIDTAAKNLAVVSPDTSKEITSVNREIEQASAALEFLQKNPFNLDAEAAKLQIESLTSAIDAAKARQAELNTELGNMPTQIAASMEIAVVADVPDAASMEIAVVADVPDPLVENPAPVSVPIEWQTDGLEVFTGTGIERFQQEIQSANNMLNTLNATQSKIVQTAAKTDLFPESAVADITSVQSRLTALQQKIQQIESNPINIGSDTANAGMERLRGQLSQALAAQQALNTAAASMDISAANEAYLQLLRTLGSTEQYIRDNTSAQGQFNSAIEQGTSKADGLMGAIKGAVAAYATLQTAKQVIELSDTMTSTEARLNLIVDDGGSVEELQNKIMASAQASRASYLDTADAIASMGANAGAAFSGNDELIAFMEQVNKQFVIGGATAQGQSAAMLQLTQAMAAGALRGEELNSILENAPGIARAIESYMGVAEGSIKQYAQDGAVTAEVVKNALFAAADETNAKFESMPMTFAQIWTSFQNYALEAFEPVLSRMNEIANSESFQSFVNSAITAVSVLASVALEVFNAMASIASFVADNWSIISPIIYGVVTALSVYTGYLGIMKAAEIASKAAKVLMCLASYAHAAATGAEASATAAATAAQYGLNTALLACPITWIIVAIIALIAIFYAAVAAVNKFAGTSVSATGVICGAFAVAGAIIGNLIIALVNFFIDGFTRLWNFIAAFANFFANVFNDPVGAIARLFFDLVDTVLSLLQTLASAIDTIFGTNLSGAVQGWRDSLSGWVDSAFGKGVEVMAKVNAEDYHLKRFEYKTAWNRGYSFGQGIEDTVSNLDLVQDYDSFTSYDDIAGSIASVSDSVEGIASDTDAMRESMELSAEELELLRDIAERETINKFTTAELHIDMTGMTNKIESDIDLDGLVSSFVQRLGEELAVTPEGVHI